MVKRKSVIWCIPVSYTHLVPCAAQDPADCPRSEDCATLPVWRGLNRVINEYLDGITLQDLLDQQRAHYANDYMI